MKPGRYASAGFALVELVVAIVIVAAVAAVLMTQLAGSANTSARTLITVEAATVGASYAELIAARAFVDPDGVDGEGARANFDDVDDYDGLHDLGARDAAGNPLAGLTTLDIQVSVRPSAALAGIPAADVRRVDVTVRDASGQRVVYTAYRVRS